MATVTSLGFNISSRFDGSGTERANRAINRLQRNLNNSSTGLNTFTGRLGAAILSVGSLGPALLPVTNVLGGMSAGLLAVGAAAGIGAGVFARATKDAIEMTNGLAAAHKHLTPAQQNFVRLEKETKKITTAVTKSYMNQKMMVATDLLGAYNHALPQINTLVGAFFPPIKRATQAIQDWVDRSNGLNRSLANIKKFGVPALDGFIRIGRNLLSVLGTGWRAVLPLGGRVVQTLVRGSAALRSWSDGGGFTRWVASVRRQGPAVSEFFRQLWGAIKNVSRVLGGLASGALRLATDMARLLASMDPGTIRTIVNALFAWKSPFAWILVNCPTVRDLIIKIMSALKPKDIYAIALALGVLKTTLWALNAELIATPVGLIITGLALLAAGIYLLATRTRFFQTIWNGLKVAFNAVVNFLHTKWGWLIALMGPVGWMLAIAMHWRQVWGVVKAVSAAVWGWLVNSFNNMTRWFHDRWFTVVNFFVMAWRAVSGPLRTAWNVVWGVLRGFAHGVWLSMQQLWRGLCFVFGPIFRAGIAAFMAVWRPLWAGVRAVASAIWAGIRAAWRGLCFVFGPVFRGAATVLVAAWRAVWGGIRAVGIGIWNSIRAAWRIACVAFGAVARVGLIAVRAVWGAVWGGIRRTGVGIWHNMTAIWRGFCRVIGVIARAGLVAVRAVWNAVWGGIRRTAVGIWRSIRALWRAFVTGGILGVMRVVGRAISRTWSSIWGSVRRTAASIWRNIASIGARVFRGLAHTLRSIWNGIKNAARSAWNALKKIVSTPIKFVINTVIGGLAKTFNSIARAVHLGIRVPVPHVNFADGGHVRGRGGPRQDNIPAMLSNGEYVMPAHVVKQKGVGFFDSLRKGRDPMKTEKGGAFNGSGILGMALGGIIPNPIDIVKGAVKSIGGAITGALGFLKKIPGVGNLLDLFGTWTKGMLHKALGGITGLIGKIPGAGIAAKVGGAMIRKLIDGAIDLLFKKSEESFANLGGKIPGGKRKAVLMAALRMAHVPPPGSMGQWLAGLNTLITRESGWNAGSINKWDSNAAKGMASRGLAQVIPPTFNAYAPAAAKRLGIMNPVANVAAAIRYIVARYGNITRVQQANAHMAPKGYAGGGLVANSYDRGGYLPRGWSMAFNGTGRPERVGHHLDGKDAPTIEFHGCTFVGSSRREWMDLFVKAHKEAERKKRI